MEQNWITNIAIFYQRNKNTWSPTCYREHSSCFAVLGFNVAFNKFSVIASPVFNLEVCQCTQGWFESTWTHYLTIPGPHTRHKPNFHFLLIFAFSVFHLLLRYMHPDRCQHSHFTPILHSRGAPVCAEMMWINLGEIFNHPWAPPTHRSPISTSAIFTLSVSLAVSLDL